MEHDYLGCTVEPYCHTCEEAEQRAVLAVYWHVRMPGLLDIVRDNTPKLPHWRECRAINRAMEQAYAFGVFPREAITPPAKERK